MSALHSPFDAPPRAARLSPEDVAASQRERMLRAMVVAVAEKGYASTVVADVVARARVSRKTFYEHFDGLLDCFLAAYDACLDHLRAALVATLDPELTVAEQLRGVIAAYLRLLVDEPELARTYLVEAYAAGDEAIRRRQRTLAEFARLFAAMHERMRAEGGVSGPALDQLGYEMIVGSVIATVTARVATGRTATLPHLAAPLHAHVLRGLGHDAP